MFDFLRQAGNFASWNLSYFYKQMLDQLADVLEDTGGANEQKEIEQIYDLCHRHGLSVGKAIKKMYSIHYRPFESQPKDSFFSLLSGQPYLRPPARLLAEEIIPKVEEFIRRAFSIEKPKDEPDLNAKIDGFLSGHREEFRREYPSISFATARTVPDFSTVKHDLLIELKYVRGNTTPSKVTDGIAADLTKYPAEALKLFIVYDPAARIREPQLFKRDFESKENCLIHIV